MTPAFKHQKGGYTVAINEDLIKEILENLNKVYPEKISRMEEVVPKHENQEEVCSHIFHCKDMGWVEFIDVSSKDGKACMEIKITPPGIDYLKSIS